MQVTLKLLQGFETTVLIFVVPFVLSIPLGVLFCWLSMSRFKAVRKSMQIFICIIRGTPLMLQIMAVFYVPGLLFHVPALNRMVAAILAIVINYAVYFSEVFRAGYQSVDAGQREAAQVLGLLRTQTFTHVYLMQVIKKVLPPLTNETISLVKDTALARAVAVTEIILAAEKIVATHAIIYALFYTGLFYLAFNGLLSLLFNFFEKKLSYYEG